jgi:hypothetical protein
VTAGMCFELTQRCPGDVSQSAFVTEFSRFGFSRGGDLRLEKVK